MTGDVSSVSAAEGTTLTTDERERLAAVLMEHQWSPSRGTCWCGWEPASGHLALTSAEDQFCRHQAHELLADRAAAGPSTDTSHDTTLRDEWGHRYPDGSVIADSSEVVAVSRAAMSRVGGRPLVLMHRFVTEWEESDRG